MIAAAKRLGNAWLFLAVFLWGSGSGCAAQPETVRIGVCLSLSGEFRDYGRMSMAGLQLFVDDANSRSEETGIKYELFVRDDESKPEAAAKIVEELSSVQQAPVIVSPISTGIMAAMIPKAREHRVVLISPGATGADIGRSDDWSFRMLHSDDYQGVALGRFCRDYLKMDRAAAVVNDNFEYGPAIYHAFAKAFEARGGKIVEAPRYKWNLDEDKIPDFTTMLAAVKNADPQIVLLPGYAEDAAAVILQSQSVDLYPVFCGGESWINKKVILQAGNNVVGSYFIGSADLYDPSPAAKRFASLFDMSNDPYAELGSVDAFDAMTLIEEACRKGARSAEEIRDSLYALGRFPVAAGNICFDREIGTRKTMYIRKIERKGDDFVSTVVAKVEPD